MKAYTLWAIEEEQEEMTDIYLDVDALLTAVRFQLVQSKMSVKIEVWEISE